METEGVGELDQGFLYTHAFNLPSAIFLFIIYTPWQGVYKNYTW
jgi:hypothetical protein